MNWSDSDDRLYYIISICKVFGSWFHGNAI
jgi:hypothetical protein